MQEADAIFDYVSVVFFYSVFPGSLDILAEMGISLHHLCTWWDVLEACRDRAYFSNAALAGVQKFL